MGRALVDFALGAALIALPQYKVPVLLGTAVVQAARSLAKRHENGNAEATNAASQAAESSVVLEWDHLTCSLTTKKGGTKTILDNVSGKAKPGRLLAIMGPSGGGKTTLLNVLAGQLPAAKGMALSGRVLVNGQPLIAAKPRKAYVQQEDIFYSQLTVRETLLMAAHLRMAEAVPANEKDALVEDLMKRLGLAKSADTVVGDAKVRGLSGGEKKRLSIGVELIASPRLVFADGTPRPVEFEPTTGLDSFQASKVMETLKALAGDGCTVVVSIHQPRSSIYELFDDLVLLSEGGLLLQDAGAAREWATCVVGVSDKQVYSGPAGEAALHFFARHGHRCPQNYNPAEYLADLISVDTSSPAAEAASRERIKTLVRSFGSDNSPESSAPDAKFMHSAAPATSTSGAVNGQQSGVWTQFRLLFSRSWRQIRRDRATNVSRAMSNVSSALIFGSIFFRMGRSQSSIQDRMGLLQVAAINCAMSSLVKTLNVFPRERAIVSRERAKGSYGIAPYFGAKLLAESPIGALFPALFASIVYPAAGLHPKVSRFAQFLGVLTLESFASTSLGLAVGAVAPSTDAALAIGPGVMVLFIVFGMPLPHCGYYVNANNTPSVLRWIPKTSLIGHAFEGLCTTEFRGLEFDPTKDGRGDINGEQVLQRLSFQGNTRATLRRQTRVLAFNYWFTYCVLKAKKPRFQPLAAVVPASDAAPAADTRPVTDKPAARKAPAVREAPGVDAAPAKAENEEPHPRGAKAEKPVSEAEAFARHGGQD